MRGVAHLAWRYLAYHKGKTSVLVLAITLILSVPAGLRVVVSQAERELTVRAAATPLLIGAKGSPLELALRSLYATGQAPPAMRYAEVARVTASKLALPIPLYIRFRAERDPIVGTTLDYFDFQNLRVASGRQMTRLGDCVVGWRVARRRGVRPGETIVSSTDNAFDLAGVYPLKMHVTGILDFSDSPDDDAIFVDLKTAWLMQGLGHGHEDLSRPEAAAQVLRREGSQITANASVVQYNEVTDDNITSFHFHGDMQTYPITAIIAVPNDERAGTLLMGRYESADAAYQIIRPLTVMRELLDTVVRVEGLVVLALGAAGAATLAAAALVFWLSLRLRRREMETMSRIGGSRARVAAVMASEVSGVVLLSLALTALLVAATAAWSQDFVRWFLVQ